MKIDWRTTKVRTNPVGNVVFYYIGDDDGNVLHSDGQVSTSLVNKEGAWDTFFLTEKHAKNCLDKHKPNIIFKDVKIGELFSFVGENYRYVRVSSNELASCLDDDYIVKGMSHKLHEEVIIYGEAKFRIMGDN